MKRTRCEALLVVNCQLTGADVHDVIEGVSSLHDVHHQLGQAHVVLGEQGVDSHRLDHVVHEEEALSVLEAAFCQVPTGTVVLQRTTLRIRRGGGHDQVFKLKRC